jgi:hypothetical protein
MGVKQRRREEASQERTRYAKNGCDDKPTRVIAGE